MGACSEVVSFLLCTVRSRSKTFQDDYDDSSVFGSFVDQDLVN